MNQFNLPPETRSRVYYMFEVDHPPAPHYLAPHRRDLALHHGIKFFEENAACYYDIITRREDGPGYFLLRFQKTQGFEVGGEPGSIYHVIKAWVPDYTRRPGPEMLPRYSEPDFDAGSDMELEDCRRVDQEPRFFMAMALAFNPELVAQVAAEV